MGFVLAFLAVRGVLPPALYFPFAGVLLVAWVALSRRRAWAALLATAVLVFLPLLFLYGGRSVIPWVLLFGLGDLWLAALLWGSIRGRYLPDDSLKVSFGRIEGWLPAACELPGQDRYLHVHVLGPTGAGKSEGVLWPLLAQDLARPVGITLVDPKGDLAARLGREAERRGRKLLLLGPEGGIGWNPLAGPAARAAETAAYALEGALPTDNSFFRTLTETLLKTAVVAVKEARGEAAGLKDVLAFLSDEDERRAVLLRVRDEGVLAFYRNQYASWTKKARDEYTMGLRNALADLLFQPRVAAILGGDGLDLPQHLAEGSVLAVSLPIAEFGASGRLLGRFLLAAFIEAALSREAEAPPHFLYVDEFQEFATRRFEDFLAMARSYRVGAVLAHQNLGQLTPELREVVLANARTRVLLGGLSLEDLTAMAESLGRRVRTVAEGGAARLSFAPKYDPLTVRALPRGRALVQTVARGQVQEPCIVRLNRP